MNVIVNYLDTIEGGSGQTSMSLEDLPMWLARRRGTLIREIIPNSMQYDEYKDARRLGYDELRDRLAKYL